MVLTYASSAAVARCVGCSAVLIACGCAWGRRCLGRKNPFAIIVGITALAITVPTRNEYCSWVMM
jgi:hypothetical protein